MRFKTIRARVAVLSSLFAVLLVGGVTVTTYFVVATGASAAAQEASDRLSLSGRLLLDSAVDASLFEADRRGLSDIETHAYVARTITADVPDTITAGIAREATISLHVWVGPDSGPVEAWSAGTAAAGGSAADRLEAVETGEVVNTVLRDRPLVAGMLLSADLGQHVAYVPVDIPGIDRAVLQVEYSPLAEETMLDTTRLPMLLVVLLSLAIALFVSNLTTRWTLSLVDDLRRTADSIDVGQLDVQLPEEGENEVAELARSLNRLIVSLRRRNEAQSRFIADASHELATPVAGIRGYVNILRAWGAEDPALREEAVSAIDRESRRMARLCSDLLSMIRNEEVVEYRQIRYDVNAVAREVLANAATRYMDKQFDFRGPEEGPLWLYGDPDRIEEALGILVDNACKYTPDGGRVSVTTRRHRDRVVMDVADTGLGIPAEDLANVFDRFYRSDLSRSKDTGGFGLGLAIAKHIVDASGGTIVVRSIVGKGTTFEVSLPRQRTRIV
ncbi:MAG: ATP-binding protein [Coriobacteriia bacterium]|nr:ATP-binding protein [Coriobacteriia bacterium]